MKPAPIDPPQIWSTLWQGVSGDVGWDVGANCGQTIPIMTERFMHVYAFEPARECWPYLDAHLQANDRLMVSRFALSDTDGTVELIALPEKIGTGELVTAGTHGMEWDPDSDAATARTVECRTVDSLLKDQIFNAPDFMKIDVEGHEMKVLTGAKRTLVISRPDLLIEFHSKPLWRQVNHFLEAFGYQCTTIRHPHYTAGSDLYFTHGWIRASV